ncbi:hypothetical protein [Kordiimonas sp. SCSIO 12610]|uniref:hypothetical protein n=1 Tax=Kordiimonas sp. SCSIO 12610 TaxID=2829597 RepID=UPI00210AFEAF|nr:hypothetical protein [Kordiimonas sp. SCSIO 12610]UTW56033.1 hypothetical protein KFF44_03825 [Kordiimonas sp. SCSIO 12610]
MKNLSTLIMLLLIVGCAGREPEAPRTGLFYNSWSIWGSSALSVLPTGKVTIHRNGKEPITFYDRRLWIKIRKIIADGAGFEKINISGSDEGLCDGGTTSLSAFVAGKTAYSYSDETCDSSDYKSDKAGREIQSLVYEIFKKYE